jgi:hypothetical protein
MPTVSFLCLLMLTPVAIQVQAVTPFDTDHDQECSDAKLSDSADKYTSQPQNLEFMDGYKAGYDACSNKDSGVDGTSESQSIRQPQFSNQNGR